jgi:hypothetical protein
MKNLKKILVSSKIFSKVCISQSINLVEKNNLHFLLGYRKSLFSIINPKLFQYSLKSSFLFIECFKKQNFKFVIISGISDSILFTKFSEFCSFNKIILLKDTEIQPGFLTNNHFHKNLIITLFLDTEKTELIQKETFLKNVPLISFSTVGVNRLSSSFNVAGNYNSFKTQNLILTLLSVCFKTKK